MSEALYRKYRPQTFEDVVGQTHIERTLKNAIEQDKVGHAYMFCGPAARAKPRRRACSPRRFCAKRGPRPLPMARANSASPLPRVTIPMLPRRGKAARASIMCEEIIGRVQYAPTRGRYKVYIIDEVHMLDRGV